MHSITIDLINENALKLLQDMELLKLIRLHENPTETDGINWSKKYKGAMTKQSLTEIDNQLNSLRNEWE